MTHRVLPRALLLVLAGCAPPATRQDVAPPADRPEEGIVNTLTPEESRAGWRLLFDGETTNGWRGFRRDAVPDGWQVEDGTLARVAAGGDIVTVEQYENFELRLEWKVGPAGNSGIFFRVSENTEESYHNGPEMQVLDDERHPDGASTLTSAGSTYALYPCPRGVVRPAGEWNAVRIVVDGAHVEQWLNGVKVVEYELWSDEWEERVRNSKFAEWPAYGRNVRGHVGLQDHGDPVWYRNVKIRALL